MKIVFVLENYIPHIGGVETLFQYICEDLAKDNEVIVLTHRLKDTIEEETINRVRVIRINVPFRGARYFFSFLSLPTLFRVCRSADVIHTTTYNGAPPAALASWVLQKPSIITIHEVIGENWSRLLDMSWLSGKLHQFLEWLVVCLPFDRYVCVSSSTKTDFEKVNQKKKGIVVYNGIDYELWNPQNFDEDEVKKTLGLENRFSCLFFGRPGPSKGFEFLVKALPLLVNVIPNIVLIAILSKDKAYENRYNKVVKLISDLGVEDYVKVLEPVRKELLPGYIKAVDCVVVPSLTEGFGFAVAESCAMEKPVVACNTKSIPEVVSGEYILVKPKSHEAIYEGIVRVYKGNLEKQPVRKFTWHDCIVKYRQLYREIIDEST